jgi:putative FmdB family regulatory protein
MAHYEFLCHNCKKLFAKILSLIDYEEGEILCPHCGSKEVEQTSVGLLRHRVEKERLKRACTIFGRLTPPQKPA